MTTDSTDKPSESHRLWSRLTREASSEVAHDDLDIRIPLRLRLESTSQWEVVEASAEPLLWEDLLALSGLRWLRISLIGATGASATLLVVGARALLEIGDLVYFNGPLQLPF